MLVLSSVEFCDFSWISSYLGGGVSILAQVQSEHTLVMHTGQEYQMEDWAMEEDLLPSSVQATLEEQMICGEILFMT